MTRALPQPDNGRYPTTAWPSGVTIPDRHVLAAAIQPGMTLRVGLYLPGSGLRAPLLDGRDAVQWAWEDAQ